MENCLSDTRFEEVKVDIRFAEEFDAFCGRNNIPAEVRDHHGDEYTYLVRAGRDYSDAQIMVYQMGWSGKSMDEPDVSAAIADLAFSYFFWVPEYEYEWSMGHRNREDELIISSAVGW